MSEANIYGVTGFSFAGKTSFSYALEPLGYEVVEIGEHVKEIVDQYRDEGQSLGDAIEDLDESIIIDGIDQVIAEYHDKGRDVVASGVRSREMEDHLREVYDAEIISVDAGYETRRERMLKRDGNSDDFTGEALSDRDGREARTGLSHVISNADRHVRNEGNIQDLAEEALEIGDPWKFIQSTTNDYGTVDRMAKSAIQAVEEEG